MEKRTNLPKQRKVLRWLELTSLGVICTVAGAFIYQFTQTNAAGVQTQRQVKPVMVDSSVSKEVQEKLMNYLPSKNLELTLQEKPLSNDQIQNATSIATPIVAQPVVTTPKPKPSTLIEKVEAFSDSSSKYSSSREDHYVPSDHKSIETTKKNHPKKISKPAPKPVIKVIIKPTPKPGVTKPVATKPVVTKPAPAPKPVKSCITVYEDIHFQGQSKTFCSNDSTLVNNTNSKLKYGMKNWNDVVSSFKVSGSGNGVVVYEHINYGGHSWTFKPGEAISDLTKYKLNDGTWNDVISSIKIK